MPAVDIVTAADMAGGTVVDVAGGSGVDIVALL